MQLNENTEFLRHRHRKLESARQNLRRKFIGIDHVIDGVLHAISTWYCFPQLQERCLVINLWGMTGTGKTSLVQELVRELELEDRYNHFDLRRSGDSQRKFEDAVLEALDAAAGQHFVMAFDEFQHARTLDENGFEIGHPVGNLVWQLIGNPVFQPVDSGYGHENLKTVIAELEWLIAHGLEAEKGIVTKELALFREFCQYSRFFRIGQKEDSDMQNGHQAGLTQQKTSHQADQTTHLQTGHQTDQPPPLVHRDLVSDIWDYCKPAFPTPWQLKCALAELDAPGTLAFLKQRLLEMGQGTQYHSKAGLIFIIGNLDEVYSYSRSLSFGDDPDFHYANTADIPVIQAKRALQKRFRPEQIARLGNNFFLYPALNQRGYERLIRQELDRLADRFNVLTGVTMRFRGSVIRMLMTEAVQPSLGTRPVFTSIQRWIESCLGIWVMGLAEYPETSKVEVGFKSGSLRASYLGASGRTLHIVAHRPEGLQRMQMKVPQDDQQASVAVHESGHAVLCMVLKGQIPHVIHSWLPHDEELGFVRVKKASREVVTRRQQLNELAIMLGGFAAEQLVFGIPEQSVGSGDDLRRATSLAASMVKRLGMGSKAYYVDLASNMDPFTVQDAESFDQEVRRLLDGALDFALEILKEHKGLLTAMSRELADKSRLTCAETQKILDRFPDAVAALEEEQDRMGHREIVFGVPETIQRLHEEYGCLINDV